MVMVILVYVAPNKDGSAGNAHAGQPTFSLIKEQYGKVEMIGGPENIKPQISNSGNEQGPDAADSPTKISELLRQKFGLREENLAYYGNFNINGEFYYGFYVQDVYGGARESLLVCNKDMSNIGLYDPVGNFKKISGHEFDTLNSNVYPGAENGDKVTTTGNWEDVLDQYITALIIDKDREKATSLTDPSYYYIDNGYTEKYRMHFVEDLARYQEDIILSTENLDKMVSSGEWDSYTIDYVISTIHDYDDSYGVAWVDVYFPAVLS